MKNLRRFAVFVSLMMSAGLLTACGDDEAESAATDAGVTEAPVTETPPTSTPAPAAGAESSSSPSAADDSAPSTELSPDVYEDEAEEANGSTNDASSANDEDSNVVESGSADDSKTDITPEPDTQS